MDAKLLAERKEILKFYERAETCTTCGNLYGSDEHEIAFLCPICVEEKKMKTQRMNRALRKNRFFEQSSK